jgi:aconitate hydratase
VTNHLTSALFASHGAGWPEAGQPVRLLVDQVLLEEDDGLVTLLAFESLGRARHACALALVAPAHEAEGPDARADLGYLRTVASSIGASFVRPGAGAPAAVHRRGFAAPGRALLATATGAGGAGAFAMLVLDAGPTETAAALAGDALRLERPPVFGVRLGGVRPPATGGAEVLEALARRLDGAARGAIVEYSGEGLASLPMSERIAMASLGASVLGARASVFPSDGWTRAYLAARGREADWRPMEGGDEGFEQVCEFDLARVAAPGRHGGRVRFGAFAEDEDVRALSHIAGTPDTLSGVDVVVGGRAARAALAADGTLEALEAAGATVRDAGDPRSRGPVEPGTRVCGDDAEVAAGRARPVSVAALGAWLGGADVADGKLPGEDSGAPAPATGATVLAAGPTALASFAASALPAGEVLAPAPPGEAVTLERAAAHVPPEPSTPFADSPRGVVLRSDPGDVACEDVLGRGPRSHAARGDAAALATLSSRRADAEAAGRTSREAFSVVTAAGRYGDGEGHDAAARATRALGIRVVIARAFASDHARALAAQGVLPLCWRAAGDACLAAPGDELEFTLVGEALARRRNVPIRALSRGYAFATQVALDDAWCDVAQAGGLLALLARESVTTVGD